MSGLYNLVHGEHRHGHALVALLNGVRLIDVGRYRDAWVERDGDVPLIRVHTRNGGGNRECWCDDEPCSCGCPRAIESMRAHPWYVRDADADFDSTYADFWFRPELSDVGGERLRAILVAFAEDPVDMDERWRTAIDAIRRGDG